EVVVVLADLLHAGDLGVGIEDRAEVGLELAELRGVGEFGLGLGVARADPVQGLLALDLYQPLVGIVHVGLLGDVGTRRGEEAGGKDGGLAGLRQLGHGRSDGDADQTAEASTAGRRGCRARSHAARAARRRAAGMRRRRAAGCPAGGRGTAAERACAPAAVPAGTARSRRVAHRRQAQAHSGIPTSYSGSQPTADSPRAAGTSRTRVAPTAPAYRRTSSKGLSRRMSDWFMAGLHGTGATASWPGISPVATG